MLVIATVNGARADGVLRIAVSTLAPGKANPYQGITTPAVLPFQAIFDSLTAIDTQGQVIPQLALNWESPDAIRWTFTLRPNVQFSNGEPFDADAVLASVGHMKSLEGRAETIGSTLYQIKAARALDEGVVEIELSEPDTLFPLHAAVWKIPAPNAWRTLDTVAFSAQPVGTGPFQVIQWGESQVKLRAFHDSWRAPVLDGLLFQRVPDQTARLQALVSGATDVAMGLSAEDQPTVEGRGGQLALRLTPTVHFLAYITTGESPVRDVRVRRALNYAVNRELIIAKLLGGATRPTGQLAPPGGFGYDPGLSAYPYDPEKARQLLRDAGYGEGLKLTISVSLTGGNDSLYYQYIAADLAKVGVDVNLQALPRSLLITRLFSGTMEGDIFNLLVRGLDPLQAYRHRTCADLTVQRVPYHCDAELASLLATARAETRPDAAEALYRQVLNYERDNPPGLFLWQAPEFDGLSGRVRNYAPVQDVVNFHELAITPQ